MQSTPVGCSTHIGFVSQLRNPKLRKTLIFYNGIQANLPKILLWRETSLFYWRANIPALFSEEKYSLCFPRLFSVTDILEKIVQNRLTICNKLLLIKV